MNNIELLYKDIKAKKISLLKGIIRIDINFDKIDSKALMYLLQNLKYLLDFKYKNYTILINFKLLNFADKITYLILDAIIYDLFKRTAFDIGVCFNGEDSKNVHNDGFSGTALYRSWGEDGHIDKKKFISLYEKGTYIDRKTYRRLLSRDLLNDYSTPSIINSDVASILKTCCDDEEWVDEVAEVTSELVDNVGFHTDSDCLIDINIEDQALKSSDVIEKPLLLVNIAIINFSKERLFDKIKLNLDEKNYKDDDKLYSRIYKAYETHKEFFNKDYTDEDFCLVTAFQKKVTTRSLKSGSSGTGLTKLIQNIIDKTYLDYSYVLSGNPVLFFKSECLSMSDEGFIGFNRQNDYFNARPAEDVIYKSSLNIPGSIYNLLLIKEK